MAHTLSVELTSVRSCSMKYRARSNSSDAAASNKLRLWPCPIFNILAVKVSRPIYVPSLDGRAVDQGAVANLAIEASAIRPDIQMTHAASFASL